MIYPDSNERQARLRQGVNVLVKTMPHRFSSFYNGAVTQPWHAVLLEITAHHICGSLSFRSCLLRSLLEPGACAPPWNAHEDDAEFLISNEVRAAFVTALPVLLRCEEWPGLSCVGIAQKLSLMSTI